MQTTTEASSTRPPLPPFTRATAQQKVRAAEDAWNTQNPQQIALAYSANSQWRNRREFIEGRENIIRFLKTKWQQEHDYRLIKELWAFEGARIAVRFAYEWHDKQGNWRRSYGNENWQFNDQGLMSTRFASINDLTIDEAARLFHWPSGPRPMGHQELSELNL